MSAKNDRYTIFKPLPIAPSMISKTNHAKNSSIKPNSADIDLIIFILNIAISTDFRLIF